MDAEPKALQCGRYCRTLEVRIKNGIMSNLCNKCEGHKLINRPPTSPYLHDYWWRNKPPTTLKKAKLKQKNISNKAKASPLLVKSDIPP